MYYIISIVFRSFSLFMKSSKNFDAKAFLEVRLGYSFCCVLTKIGVILIIV